ncbi:MAG: hypothetical protein ACRCZF_20455, partial [Gemmataceae bacterium]
SNRYLDLPPLVARLAAEQLWETRLDEDSAVTDTERADGKTPSTWLFLMDPPETLGRGRQPWRVIEPAAGPIWTDESSNLFSVWKKEEK